MNQNPFCPYCPNPHYCDINGCSYEDELEEDEEDKEDEHP